MPGLRLPGLPPGFPLEDGALHETAAPCRLAWRARIPVDLRLRWLRETSRGILRSHLPLQFSLPAPVEMEVELRGRMRKRVRRTGSRVEVSYFPAPDGGEPIGAAAWAPRAAPPEPDLLLAALLSIHPLEWFREAATCTGSRERTLALAAHGASSAAMERLAERWRALDLEREARVWESLSGAGEEAREVMGGGELFDLLRAMHRYALDAIRLDGDCLWVHQRLRDFLGGHTLARLEMWQALRARLFAKALEALEAQAADALALAAQSAAGPLARAEFDLSAEGEAAPCGALAEELQRRRTVEIELPFRSRDEVMPAAETFLQAGVRVEAGRRVTLAVPGAGHSQARRAGLLALAGLFAHRGERWDTAPPCVFTLERGYDPAAGPDALFRLLPGLGMEPPRLPASRLELSLMLPGEWFAAWVSAPSLRHEDHARVFSRVSGRMQRLLRAWLPALWLNGADRFAMREIAYPLLVYAATPPREPEAGAGHTYDSTLAKSLTCARKRAAAALPALLAEIEGMLLGAGRADLAEHYAPARTREVLRAAAGKTGLYPCLLRQEGFLLGELIELAENARELRRILKTEPSKAGRWLARASAETARRMQRRLAAGLRGMDPGGLAALVIMDATLALAGEPPSRIEARLRAGWNGLRRAWKSEAGPIRRTALLW